MAKKPQRFHAYEYLVYKDGSAAVFGIDKPRTASPAGDRRSNFIDIYMNEEEVKQHFPKAERRALSSTAP